MQFQTVADTTTQLKTLKKKDSGKGEIWGAASVILCLTIALIFLFNSRSK